MCDQQGISSIKGKTMNAETKERYCLLLPGKVLYLSPLLAAKKFRNKGNKSGALTALRHLEQEGLGKLKEVGASTGLLVWFYVVNMNCTLI